MPPPSSPKLLLGLAALGVAAAAAPRLVVYAKDGHALHVHGRFSAHEPDQSPTVLLLHGRTWSAAPVWDLGYAGDGGGSASFMERLSQRGVNCYALDLRGFGATPEDATGGLTPGQAAEDVEVVLRYLRSQGAAGTLSLVGWSQGAMVAHLVAQRLRREGERLVDRLVLYGSIYRTLGAEPLAPALFHTGETSEEACEEKGSLPERAPQTVDESMEDFTTPGSVSEELAQRFGEAVVEADPRKGRWFRVDQFSECRGSRILRDLPVMLIHGARDPYVDKASMLELFASIDSETKQYVQIGAADHPAHLLFGEEDEGLHDSEATCGGLAFEKAVVQFIR